MSAVRRTAILPADRYLQGQALAQIDIENDKTRGTTMGEMKRAQAWEEQQRRKQDRFFSTVVIAASIIAAVRLARESDISRPSPRLQAVITDSVQLARMILSTVLR